MLCRDLLSLIFPGLLLASALPALPEDGAPKAFVLRAEEPHWVVENCSAEFGKDRVIRGAKGNGWIRSVHRQRDFILELEWMPEKDGFYDAGVFFRAASPKEGQVWPDFFQLNLKTGAVGKLKNVAVDEQTQIDSKDQGWNGLKIVAKGKIAAAHLNGKPIWITPHISEPQGYIALQVEEPKGGVILYRNVQITEIGFENLLRDGLTGWEAAEGEASACWKREGDELVCTGAKGPWLRYGKPVKDFNLRLDFLLREGGNSGVYVRVPPDGVHHGAGSGIEVQILDNASPRYQELKPYQYSGSLYAIVPADPRVARPAGKWNTLEIDCKSDRYVIWQNGVEILVADGKTAPELLERRSEGYFGLQNHSEEVRFRNIRLGDSQQ